jgi:glyoxylase-like metal-dependent hydrolase (beta-lactamase superfamily II)
VNPLPVVDTWFEAQRIDEAITLITEPHVDPLLGANTWHVRGRDRDLLVDTGLGVAALRPAFPDLFEREPVVIITHGHLDHQGSAYEFRDVWAHRLEDVHGQPGSLFARPLLTDLLLAEAADAIDDWDLPELLITARPDPEYNPADYRLRHATLTRLVEDGDLVDLGDRSFEVLHLPGHTPGSIGLLDRRSGVLFSGDVIYDGELIDNCVGASPDAYVATMNRLMSLEVEVVHAGHDASFDQARLRVLARQYLAAQQEAR